MENLSRKERERRERIRHILNVAGSLFARRGFFKVSMKDIAERAEFALGTLYGFFKGKRQLYHQLIQEKIDEQIRVISEQMASETSPVGIIKKFIEAKLRFFYDNLDFVRLYFAEMHGPPVYGENAHRRKYQELLAKITSVFEEGIKKGEFINAPANLLASMLDGQTSALAFSWLDKTLPESPEMEIELAKRVLLTGVLVKE